MQEIHPVKEARWLHRTSAPVFRVVQTRFLHLPLLLSSSTASSLSTTLSIAMKAGGIGRRPPPRIRGIAGGRPEQEAPHAFQ